MYKRQLIEGVILDLQALDDECKVLVSSFSHSALAEFKKQSRNTPVACLFEKIDFELDWQLPLEACQAQCVHLADEE